MSPALYHGGAAWGRPTTLAHGAVGAYRTYTFVAHHRRLALPVFDPAL